MQKITNANSAQQVLIAQQQVLPARSPARLATIALPRVLTNAGQALLALIIIPCLVLRELIRVSEARQV